MGRNQHGSGAETDQAEGLDAAERSALLFGIERSIRYHTRREAFFARWHRMNAFLNVLFGSATIVAIMTFAGNAAPFFAFLFPALITVLGAVDLVLGLADQARAHAEFRRRYVAIQQCLIGAFDSSTVHRCTKDRLEIEAVEPPKKSALDVLCHNELLRASGYDINNPEHTEEYRVVGWFQQLTANVFSWEGATFPKAKLKVAKGSTHHAAIS